MSVTPRPTPAPSMPSPAPHPHAARPAVEPRPVAEHQPVHAALICVAAPRLAVSAEHGQLTGASIEGFYDAGRRVLARLQLRVAGHEPIALEGRMVSAGQARFVGAVRVGHGGGPDPEITVERLRSADGTERVTVRHAGTGVVRVPVEVRCGTDLAELGALAVGRSGPELPASVHGAGLAWSAGGLRATVTADSAPATSLARDGLLHWDITLPPGGSHTLTLRTGLTRMQTEEAGAPRSPAGAGRRGPEQAAAGGPRQEAPRRPWHAARARGDDARVGELFHVALDDASALLLRDPAAPADLHLAAGAPWRCSLAPAEALRAARMLLPLGTRLAGGTLRTLARLPLIRDRTAGAGRFPGVLRQAGPHAPPSFTGVEATLLFPTVLAEARRWGLSDRDTEELVPTAEDCLRWLLTVAGADGYVPDPAPDGPFRCEAQAHAHRSALLGADLLDAYGRPGGAELREWAAGLRDRFREDFWYDDRGGGRPVALRTRTGGAIPHLGGAAAELLDTGLAGGGAMADGLLDKVQTEQLARLLGTPALDSGWGLRSLGDREPGYNPFGHRNGAVRVQETATAVIGLAAAGYEGEAASLLLGVVDASEAFGGRLPEMYAAEQRTAGSRPLPHPAACRPAAVSAAGTVAMLTALAGVRPDVPAGTVCVRPMATAPLGAVELAGLRVAEQPFSVRVSRLGMGLVEEAAGTFQLVN